MIKERKIIIWAFGGLEVMLEWESSIGYYFLKKGHDIEAIICDGISPACIRREADSGVNIKKWSRDCISCRENVKSIFDKFGIKSTFGSKNLSFYEKLCFIYKRLFPSQIRDA